MLVFKQLFTILKHAVPLKQVCKDGMMENARMPKDKGLKKTSAECHSVVCRCPKCQGALKNQF
jgi:hypothetical protein